MYAKSGRAPGFSGLYSSIDEISEPEGYLKKVVEQDIETEGGPENQDELREAMNIAYKASIERARLIDQLGGKLLINKHVRFIEPPKTELVSEKEAQKQVASRKKVLNKSTIKKKKNKKESGPTRW